MSKLTWFIQYSNISIANVGLIILGGQSLKVISNDSPAHEAPFSHAFRHCYMVGFNYYD